MTTSLAAHKATSHLLARLGKGTAARPVHDIDAPVTGLRLVAAGHAPVLVPATALLGFIPRMDDQMRIGITTAAAELGWSPRADLVVAIAADGTAHVRAFDPAAQSPAEHRASLDAQHRLVLSATVRGALGLVAREQVLAIAVPEAGVLQLRSASRALAELTGLLTPVTAAVTAPVTPAPKGRGPKAAWAPRPEAIGSEATG